MNNTQIFQIVEVTNKSPVNVMSLTNVKQIVSLLNSVFD